MVDFCKKVAIPLMKPLPLSPLMSFPPWLAGFLSPVHEFARGSLYLGQGMHSWYLFSGNLFTNTGEIIVKFFFLGRLLVFLFYP